MSGIKSPAALPAAQRSVALRSRRPQICMITGAYPPEVSGGGLQAGALVAALEGWASCRVITTTTRRDLPRTSVVGGVPVDRISLDPRRPLDKLRAGLALVKRLTQLRRQIDVLHLHGFSQKNVVVVLLNMWLRKRVVQKLTLLGEDDPASTAGSWRGWVQRWSYRASDRLVAVSPALEASSGIDRRLQRNTRLIPNGVDTGRFRPLAGSAAREQLRRELGLWPSAQIVVSVSLLATRKDPLTLWRAWRAAHAGGFSRLALVCIGSMTVPRYEIDQGLVERMRREVAEAGCQERVRFIEYTADVPRYLQAADLFMFTSRAEGLPNALLEAMATGLPCIATRLPGITDWVIEHERNGLLVEPGDATGFTQAMCRVLTQPSWAQAMGDRAQETMQKRFALPRVAEAYGRLYQELLGT